MAGQTGNTQRDVVIIGGGHNGLVTAFYLAKAGFKPLVLERSAQVGGAAVTDEFHPGFRCSTLAHTAGPIRPDIVRDMQLEKHDLRLITPDVCVTALSPDGRALTLYQDVGKSAQAMSAFSQKGATKCAEWDSHPAGSACFAAGGMGALTQAMAAAAKAAGVEIRTGAEVIEIQVQNGAATDRKSTRLNSSH